MVSIYNFIGSWQLIPEKSSYSEGVSPKSMLLSIDLLSAEKNLLVIKQNWYTHDNQSLSSRFECVANNQEEPFEHQDVADTIITTITDKDNLKIITLKNNVTNWHITFLVNAKGYLETQQTIYENQKEIYKFDIYHKQLSVLPYASSVSGVAVVPTQEGHIKHKALQAMAEQTDMHLLQIKQQIELLASQAHAIQRRKELSMIIYNAKIGFVPQIGQTYHLYERKDGSHVLSLVGPENWGGRMPFEKHINSVKLLADHTWSTINE